MSRLVLGEHSLPLLRSNARHDELPILGAEVREAVLNQPVTRLVTFEDERVEVDDPRILNPRDRGESRNRGGNHVLVSVGVHAVIIP